VTNENIFDSLKRKANKWSISDDFVFDGQKSPYDENSTPNPITFMLKLNTMVKKIVTVKEWSSLAYPYRKNSI